MVVERAARFHQQLPAPQDGADAVSVPALHMDLAIPARLKRPCDVARIDSVGLHRHRAGRRLQVSRIETDNRKAGSDETVMQCRCE
jgi:hypothetical protein